MTWFRVGPAGGGIPAALKTDMNSVLNKKFGTIAQNYPPNEWPDDVNLMGMLEVKTASGAIASISDGADDVPVKSCSVSFTPSGGGGTPSSPVAIVGYTGLTVTNKDNMTTPTQTDTYTDTFGQTIYGGSRDLVTDKASVTYAVADLGDYTYTLRNGVGMQTNGLSSLIKSPVDNYTVCDGVCEIATPTTWQLLVNSGTSSGLYGVSGGCLCIATSETDTTAFKASMVGKKIAYPLATPTELTGLTAHNINTRLGDNNFYADTGTMSVEYRSIDTIQPAPTPTLITKTITENGTYEAEDDNADGYSSVEVEVYQGDGGIPITLVATEIATDANQTGTLSFAADYHDYPILKVRTYHPTNQDYVDIYCTPQFIDDAFAYSSNKANFNRMATNLYAYYGAGQNNTWVRGGQRTITVTSVFGITSSSHDIEVVNLYRYQAIAANNRSVSFSGNTSDYQYLMISMCDGDATETEPSVPIISVGNSGIKDLVKYGAGMAYNVTRTFVIEQNSVSDFATTQKYGFFTIDGVNFTPKTAT